MTFVLNTPVDMVGDIVGTPYGQRSVWRGQSERLGRVWMDCVPFPQPSTARHAEFDLRR